MDVSRQSPLSAPHDPIPVETLAASDAWRLDDDDDKEQKRMGGTSYLERHLIESRTLLVSGPITDRLARHCAERLFVMEARDAEKPITVIINSPGGSADSGFAIYDLLRFVRPPIRTVVNGLCASAGILVHLAGDRGSRFCLPESRFMIHQPSTAGQGTASDLDITAREVIKLRERYVRIIAEGTGRDPERILEDARRDFWLNGEEAKKYGLVDRVVRERAEME
ncbi:MAG: ATP-dependent Clp protease proteolytic subunit [Planctomycetes bacterium]|nr:ATP-dependent Clp protease proteolytic subunit [Planctomycetota bacterium]